MLNAYTNLNAIAVHQAVATPEAALRLTGQLLHAGGFAEARYTEALLQSYARTGAYFVIAPGIALPHARPEAGATRTGISLLTTTTPIDFGNAANGPADLIIGLAATSGSDHLVLLQDLVAQLSARWRYAKLTAATTPEALFQLLG